MSKSKLPDVRTDPAIKRHTERIMVLQEEAWQTRIKLGSVSAASCAERVAVKAALDQLANKTAWLRWLKTHVPYSAKTRRPTWRLPGWAKKTEALSFFHWHPPCCTAPWPYDPSHAHPPVAVWLLQAREEVGTAASTLAARTRRRTL